MAALRAASYARFSTDKQTDRSIERQHGGNAEACARQGFALVARFEDRAASGASTLGRPGWHRLMAAAVRGEFDIVIVEDIDRAFRDEADYHAARKRLEFIEVALHTPAGFVSRIEGSIKALQGAMTLAHLKERVHGGLKLVVAEGRHVAAPAYGYRLIKGEDVPPGTLGIDEAEAAIVRRIFSDYVAGAASRDIASALNTLGLAGPRGGIWHASAIHGSRKRLSGILQNPLYDGRVIWNRQRWIKNPDTGRRISRLNAPAQWVEHAAPQLRIVEAALFAKAQAEKARRGSPHARPMARPKHLLTGLLKCACCGTSYAVAGSDRFGRYMQCSRMRETGTCDNRTIVRMDRAEQRVIAGLEKGLAAPETVAAYVRTYQRLMRDKLGSAEQTTRRLRQQLARLEQEARNLVDAIAGGTAARSLHERLNEIEAQRHELEAEIEQVTPPPLAFHPNAADNFRRKVADLKALLASADPAFRAQALQMLRSLIEKIVVHPTGRNKPPDLEIHGQLAQLLQASADVPLSSVESVGKLVAGVGFEPTTFRL